METGGCPWTLAYTLEMEGHSLPSEQPTTLCQRRSKARTSVDGLCMPTITYINTSPQNIHIRHRQVSAHNHIHEHTPPKHHRHHTTHITDKCQPTITYTNTFHQTFTRITDTCQAINMGMRTQQDLDLS